MLIFNWFDLVILALLIIAAVQGIRVGLFVQLFVIVGFFGGLFFAGWMFPHVLPIHDRTLLTLVNANLVLLLATFLAVRGYDLGRRFHVSLGAGTMHLLESGLGVLLSTTAVLAAVWLLSATIGRLPFVGLSNSANDAFISQKLTHHLPPVPAVFAEFNRLVDPNSSPRLFTLPKAGDPLALAVPEFELAAAKAAGSTVRVTSFGCGGTVSGSGFAVAAHVIATNAHVVAGVKRPIIKFNNHSYEAVPILFNPSLDYALLRVNDLNLSPLILAPDNVSLNTTVAVLGYPGNTYAAVPGIIRNDLHIFGSDIYDVGTVGRDVYEIQAQVDEGSSGGPVVLPDGRVAGIIFAKYEAGADYGYALTSPHLIDQLHKAEASTQRVGTGVCLAG